MVSWQLPCLERIKIFKFKFLKIPSLKSKFLCSIILLVSNQCPPDQSYGRNPQLYIYSFLTGVALQSLVGMIQPPLPFLGLIVKIFKIYNEKIPVHLLKFFVALFILMPFIFVGIFCPILSLHFIDQDLFVSLFACFS